MTTSKVPPACVPMRRASALSSATYNPWGKVGRALPCAGNTGPGLPGPPLPGRLWGPVKEAPRKTAEEEWGWGWGVGPASAPRSKGTKETGRTDTLGTCFALIFKNIFMRFFPIYSGKMFFKLRDKDFGFCKTNNDMKAFCTKNKR